MPEKRVLLIVEEVRENELKIFAPQLDTERSYTVPRGDIPPEVAALLHDGEQWFVAIATYTYDGAPSELQGLRDWEIAPEPDPADGLA